MNEWKNIYNAFISSAFEYFNDQSDSLAEKIAEVGGDSVLIEQDLARQYPSEDGYFWLVDYVNHSDEFHIRIWKHKK